MPQDTDIIIASVSPRSVGPHTLFDEGVQITSENVSQFASDPSDIRDAKKALVRADFTVYDKRRTSRPFRLVGQPSNSKTSSARRSKSRPLRSGRA